jgi:uncharacterized membrane protein YeiH
MLVLSVFEILGTVAFAVSGAVLGIQKKLDVFGVFMLAVTTAVGGGILRDLLIGITPPTSMINPKFVLISLGSTIAVCFLYEQLIKFNDIIQICDAIGLGAFTAIGANMAIEHELNTLFILIVLGMATGVGGGIIRDMFAQEIPLVFRKEIYAVASIAGAMSLFYTENLLSNNSAMYLSFFVTVVIRIVSMKYNMQLPIIKVSKMN